jgi:hypothetical protein
MDLILPRLKAATKVFSMQLPLVRQDDNVL